MTTAREHGERIGRPGPSLPGRHHRIMLTRRDEERYLRVAPAIAV